MDGGYVSACAGRSRVEMAPAVSTQDKFDYQDRGVDEIRALLKAGFKGVTYIGQTGSGKSHIDAKIARLMSAGKKKLYLAPRKLLVSGVSKVLDSYGIDHSVRMSGVPWTGGRMPDIQLWCIQSYFNYLKTFKKPRMCQMTGEQIKIAPPSVVVVDEAHTHQPAAVKLRELFPDTYFIFMTATPLPGMDRFCDAAAVVHGPCVGELQRRGILVPVRYKTYESDDRNVEALRGEIVSTWKSEGEGRKTIVFCKNRAEAKFIQEQFNLHGVAAEYMDCNTPADEREAIRKRVKDGKSQVVVNVEVMGYGVDWPFIDCVVLAYVVEAKLQDTVTRLAEYIQKVGRGIRACEGKDDLLVIDHTGTYWMFGGVEQEIRWEITKKGIKKTAEEVKQKQSKAGKDEKEPELITCPNVECGHQFMQLSTCPRCKTQIVHQNSDAVDHVPANFVEVDGRTGRLKSKPKRPVALWTKESSDQIYSAILWCVRNKRKKDGSSYSDGMAKHIHDKLQTGFNPPWPTSVRVQEPDPATMAWAFDAIRSHNAAFWVKQRAVNKKKVA